MKAQWAAHRMCLINMFPKAAFPKSSPELTGLTVIDVLVTGRATVSPVTGTAKTPRQVGAGTMGAAG